MDAQTLNPLTEQQILDAVAALQPDSVALLGDLVAQPSLLGDEAPVWVAVSAAVSGPMSRCRRHCPVSGCRRKR